jgi:hypothetical protein
MPSKVDAGAIQMLWLPTGFLAAWFAAPCPYLTYMADEQASNLSF